MSIFVIGDLHLSETADKPMDVFGGRWDNYTEKIKNNWKNTVSDGDTVVLAGDSSWGMSLDEALADFKLIDSLPGKKILIKGNHDYWWETVSKMRRFLADNGITTIDFLFNNSFCIDGVSVCGTRGWMPSEAPDDERITAREEGRLRRSLESADAGTEKVVVIHYPPVCDGGEMMGVINIMREYGVSRCFYGHLHGSAVNKAKKGAFFGINFYLVSADSIDFCPVNI